VISPAALLDEAQLERLHVEFAALLQSQTKGATA
jgi:hypothetical protein